MVVAVVAAAAAAEDNVGDNDVGNNTRVLMADNIGVYSGGQRDAVIVFCWQISAICSVNFGLFCQAEHMNK